MSDPQPISKEALLAELERYHAERMAANQAPRRAKYLDEMPLEALLWMALPPGWTLELAQTCNFPVRQGDLEKTFERMVNAGIVERTPLISTRTLTPAAAIYSMNETKRLEVLDEYKDRPEQVRRALAVIGQRINAVDDALLLPPVRDWAKLASAAEYSSDLIETFNRYIDKAFQQNDSATLLNWIRTGRHIAGTLVHDLESPININIALQQADRKLELLYRHTQDEQQLRHFLERTEQVQAFEKLMGSDDEHWALHYIGAGALGKTMFMRHITTHLAPHIDAAVARIDFDYLNPDYPRHSPGLLLWSFAQELRAYDRGTRANRKFDTADNVLRKIQKHLQSGRPGARQFTIYDPQFRVQFQEALALYIDALRALSRPIILILDTCEELARTRPEGTPLEDVEETFRILRALHDGPETLDNPLASSSDGLPFLRVIFAGRRLLASKGYKWSSPSSTLPERPYLRLHQIRGIPDDEADRYLRNKLKIPEGLIPAVIQKSSPDGGGGVHIEWEDKADQPRETRRCNPYILRLYAHWARETPPPTLEDITNATDDKYVELRIINRLRNEKLEQLLPAISLLRHFDQEMLLAASGLNAEGFDTLFGQLREQEWITQHRVTIGDGKEVRLVLSLEQGIQKRLLDYFSRRSNNLRQVKKRIVEYLEMVTLQHDLSTLNWYIFDATLRVLASHPERATTWWTQVNTRILADRDFPWVLRLTSFLTCTDGAVGPHDIQLDEGPENPLRLNVLATHAAALLHTNAAAEVATVWQEIAQKAKNHPVPAMRAELQLRALAGSIAAYGYTEVDLQPGDVQTLWQEIEHLTDSALHAQIAAALVSATEAVVEYAEDLVSTNPSAINALLLPSSRSGQGQETPPVPGPVVLAIRLYAKEFDQTETLPGAAIEGLQAFSATLAARALALLRDYTQAHYWCRKAVSSVQEKDAIDMSALWADWLPPDNLPARVRLEFIRAMCPAYHTVRETLQIVGTWQGPPSTVDTDRLHSALLGLRQAEGTIAITDIKPELLPEENFSLLTAGPVTCNAHERIAALFASSAETLALNGHVDAVLPALRFISQQADRFDVATVKHAERALIRIIRRMQLRDERESWGSSLLTSPLLSDQILLWTLDGLTSTSIPGVTFTSPDASGERFIPVPSFLVADETYRQTILHAIWQTSYILDTDTANLDLHWANTQITPYLTSVSAKAPGIDFQQASLYLDLCEAALLGEVHHIALNMYSSSARAFNPSAWKQAHPDQPVEALSLWLRYLALLPNNYPTLAIPQNLLNRVGIRKAAEIALHESELLGRRLPERALVIQQRAIDWFDSCGDSIGSLLTRIARCMILAREHRMPELGAELNSIALIYTQAVQHILQEEFESKQISLFPTWEFLVNLSRAPSHTGISALEPRSWRPWLVRLVACLIRNRQIREPNEEVLREWLTSHYATTIGNRVELPADFAGWFATHSSEQQIRHTTVDSKTTGGIDQQTNVSEDASAALRLNIVPALSATNKYQSANLLQEVELKLEELVPKPGAYTGQCVTTGLAPYRKLADNLPARLSTELQDLIWRIDRNDRSIDVTIQTASDLVGPCWEAMIALAIRSQLTPDTIRFRFKRTTVTHRTPHPPTASSTLQLLSCAGNGTGLQVAESGWQLLKKRLGTSVIVDNPQALLKSPANVSVLHLIGKAEAGSAGIRFRFTGLQSYLSDAAQSSSLSYTLEQADFQIRAVDIARQLPNVRLCIIQGDINQELTGEAIALRGESERRDAILTRTFAAELYEQGIPAVLVIPSLSPLAGRRVLERLSAILQQAQPQPTEKHFVDALTEIQTSILNIEGSLSSSWSESAREALRELALDACLYVH